MTTQTKRLPGQDKDYPMLNGKPSLSRGILMVVNYNQPFFEQLLTQLPYVLAQVVDLA